MGVVGDGWRVAGLADWALRDDVGLLRDALPFVGNVLGRVGQRNALLARHVLRAQRRVELHERLAALGSHRYERGNVALQALNSALKLRDAHAARGAFLRAHSE